ncbi:MAG: hypothetical protein C0596_10490 [Marinilabiliales bacterium]|nr:MAG: hypothetical protein C0596_10490 [Marinilabiliales bacterium]
MDGSDFTVTPSINLEISLSSGTGFTSDPIILSSYDGTATDIYVRLEAGLIPGEYNTESIVFTGGGISETDIFITGTVDENVFVNNISTSSRTEIYPNPSSDIIFIELDGWKSNKVSCEIFDMLGKQIFQSHINLFNGHTEERINLSNYDSGIYLIRLSDGQTIENLRIEKQ